MKPILQKEGGNGIFSWINGERPLPDQLRSRKSPRLENRPAHRKISQNKTLANHFLIVAMIITGTGDASKRGQELEVLTVYAFKVASLAKLSVSLRSRLFSPL